jgi:hypothetical protein
MFCAGPNFLCQNKNLFTYCGRHKHFVPDKMMICIFSKIGFCISTKSFEEALNAVKFLGWLKKFGSAQNILGPVKGQGIRNLQEKLGRKFVYINQQCFAFQTQMLTTKIL